MKVFGWLSVFSFVCLAAAAVWLGGLNQDEGWYVYAANLVAEGKMPYRDFFYTQGPLMPMAYAPFAWVWAKWGLLGARVLTLGLGLLATLCAVALARSYVGPAKRAAVSVVTFLLLGGNLYHLYYTAIPKTYALASLFVAAGFLALRVAGTGSKVQGLKSKGGEGDFAVADEAQDRPGEVEDEVEVEGWRGLAAVLAGLSLAFAAGTRISLGALLCVVGLWLLATRKWRTLGWFCVGGFGGLGLVYGPYLADGQARLGLMAAQAYHAQRGGFDPVFTVGSVSRIVRWYLPLFLVLGLGGFRKGLVLAAGFAVVFAVQMLAPFPYEDYQVPVMGLLAVFAAVNFIGRKNEVEDEVEDEGGGDFAVAGEAQDRQGDGRRVLMVLGVAWACAFGSPLLEGWMTNGQDRFWSLKKAKPELAQLRDVARRVEALDPGGKTILTQDLYLAVETGRKVPVGLEMGPFAILDDAGWRRLLGEAECPVAALSGYSFAICPPRCEERPVEQQLDYFRLVKEHYQLAFEEPAFGQNATTLLVLRRK